MKRYIYLTLLFLHLGHTIATEQLLLQKQELEKNILQKQELEKDILGVDYQYYYERIVGLKLSDFDTYQNYKKHRNVEDIALFDSDDTIMYRMFSHCQKIPRGVKDKRLAYLDSDRGKFLVKKYKIDNIKKKFKEIDEKKELTIFEKYKLKNKVDGVRLICIEKYPIRDAISKFWNWAFGKKTQKDEITTQEVVMADTAVVSALVLMNLADFLFAGITGATLGTGLLICLGGAVGAGGAGFGIWWFLNWLNIGVWLNGILSSSAGLSTIMTLGFNPVGAVGGIVVGLGSFLLQNHYNGANKISALISVYTAFQLYYFFQKRYIQPWIKKKVDEKKNKKLIKEISAFQKVKKAILTPIPK